MKLGTAAEAPLSAKEKELVKHLYTESMAHKGRIAREAEERKARETAQVVFSLASIYERVNDWKRVAEHYRSYLKKYRRQSMPHEEIRANVQIGKAYWKQRRQSEAGRYFKAAIKLWTKGAGKAKHVGFKKFLKLLHLIAAQKGIEDDKFVAAVVKRARIKTKKTVATSPVLGGRKKH